MTSPSHYYYTKVLQDLFSAQQEVFPQYNSNNNNNDNLLFGQSIYSKRIEPLPETFLSLCLGKPDVENLKYILNYE